MNAAAGTKYKLSLSGVKRNGCENYFSRLWQCNADCLSTPAGMKWQIGQKDILAFDEPEVILVNRNYDSATAWRGMEDYRLLRKNDTTLYFGLIVHEDPFV